MPNKNKVSFQCYVTKEHIAEIDLHVANAKNTGRKNKNGRPFSRNDYIKEALEIFGKSKGLLTSPFEH